MLHHHQIILNNQTKLEMKRLSVPPCNILLCPLFLPVCPALSIYSNSLCTCSCALRGGARSYSQAEHQPVNSHNRNCAEPFCVFSRLSAPCSAVWLTWTRFRSFTLSTVIPNEPRPMSVRHLKHVSVKASCLHQTK
jgi:hypothetical protein